MAHILIVDDSRTFAKAAEAKLRKAGHHVVVASEARSAVALAARQQFDLVVVEWRMPGMPEGAVVKALRSSPTGKRDARVLVVTTSNDIGLSARALGVTGILVKTRFSLQEMVDAVRLGLRERR